MLSLLFLIFLIDSTVKEAYGKNVIWDEATSGNFGIVGGHDVDIKQYPHQATVLIRLHGKFTLRCGAAIISEDYVLTSPACVYGRGLKTLKIRAGSNFAERDGETYDILSIVYHPKLNIDNNDYSIAVVKTEKITLNGVTAKAAQLPESGNALKPGDNTVSTGWGLTINPYESRQIANNLQAVSIPVITLEKCAEIYKNYGMTVTDRVFCAGLGKSGGSPCDGDVGGPVVAESNSVLYGIHLTGGYCNTTSVPVIHANIAVLRDWIKETTGV